MDAIRDAAAGVKGRAIAGAHDYEQIPALFERNRLRVQNFYLDTEARLRDVEYIAGDAYSAADITALVTVDFATCALALPIPDENVAMKRCYDALAARSGASA